MHWNSPTIEAVAIVFMTLADISFLRYFAVWRTRSLQVLARDAEVWAYVGVLLAGTAALTWVLAADMNQGDWLAALRDSEDLVSVGAYVTGSNPRIDGALVRRDAIDRFLCQPSDTRCGLADAIADLHHL